MYIVKKSEKFKYLKLKNFKINYFNLLINLLMRKGFKIKSYKIIYNFLFKLKLKFKISVNLLLNNLFNKYTIIINLIKKKVAGRFYYLPYFINTLRGQVLFSHWFIISVKERLENKLSDRLYFEFLDLNLGYGKTVRKIEDFYALALRNQPFLYFLKKKKFRSNKSLKKYHVNNVLL